MTAPRPGDYLILIAHPGKPLFVDPTRHASRGDAIVSARREIEAGRQTGTCLIVSVEALVQPKVIVETFVIEDTP